MIFFIKFCNVVHYWLKKTCYFSEIKEQDWNENSQICVNLKILANKISSSLSRNTTQAPTTINFLFAIQKLSLNLFIYRVAYLSYKETVAVGEAKKMDL